MSKTTRTLAALRACGLHFRDDLVHRQRGDAGCRHPIGDMEKASAMYEEGISCPHCHDGLTEARKRGFAERQRQVALARERKQPHIGARMPERHTAGTPTR